MTSLSMTAIDDQPEKIKLVLDGRWVRWKGRGKKRRATERAWVHPSLNEWAQVAGIAGRYRVKAIKEAWDAKIAEVARGVGKISGEVVVTVVTFIPVDRDEDIDNRTPKFILDGLVSAGVIDDDGRRTIVDLRTRIRVDRKWPRTEITIRRSESAIVDVGAYVHRRLTERLARANVRSSR